MAAANSTTYSAYLKQMWPARAVNNAVLAAGPAWGIIPKKTDWTGSTYEIAMGYGNTQGQGAVFTTAQANKSPTKEMKFELTPSTYYSMFSINRLLLRRSKNDRGAVVAALGRQSKAAIDTWSRSNSLFMFRNGGGALGVISTISTNTIILTLDADVRNFEVGMTLELSTADGTSGAVKVNATPLTITGITPSSNTLTFASNVTTHCPTAANADYIFIAGTFGSVLTGFAGWIPRSVTSSLFFGQDRTVHQTRMAGHRVNVGGLAPRAAVQKLAMELFKAGAKPTHYFVGTNEFQNLLYDLESAGRLTNTKVPAGKIDKMSFGITFDGVSFNGPTGPIDIVCDYNCPDADGYMIQLDTWVIPGIGQFPYFDNEDGNEILREANADAYEGRVVGDCQMGCYCPYYNGRANYDVAA